MTLALLTSVHAATGFAVLVSNSGAGIKLAVTGHLSTAYTTMARTISAFGAFGALGDGCALKQPCIRERISGGFSLVASKIPLQTYLCALFYRVAKRGLKRSFSFPAWIHCNVFVDQPF